MPVHSRVTTPSAFATGKTKRVPVKASNPVFQEDVFAQQYYEAQDNGDKRIYNQIDLENKGGLVWIKSVGNTQNSPMIWMDSLQGVGKYWECGETYSQTDANSLKSFNTDGFTVGQGNSWNDGGSKNYMSYTFVKQRKFFTLLQYTGDGSSPREIEHDLGCVPGMIVVKSNSDVGPNGSYYNSWVTWHRGYNNYSPNLYNTRLNTSTGLDSANGNGYWNTTSPTATKFTIGANLNYSGILYNVYIWGHNEAEEDCIFGEEENKPLIFCGYCPNAPDATHYPEIDCGMPAQFLATKHCQDMDNNTYADAWRVSDKMRGMVFHEKGPYWCMPNNLSAEQKQSGQESNANGDIGYKTAKGFAQGTTVRQTAVFMAIGDSAYRNAPLGSPTSAPTPSGSSKLASVYWSHLQENPGAPWSIGSGYSKTIDFVLNKRVSNTSGSSDTGITYVSGRYHHKRYLRWNATSNSDQWSFNNGTWAYRANNQGSWYNMAGNPNATNTGALNGISKIGVGADMAPGNAWVWTMTLHEHRKFFDMQQWVGDSQNNRIVYHNLEVEPKMIWFKAWMGNENWTVYHKDLGVSKRLKLNTTEGKSDYGEHDGDLISVDSEKILLGGGNSYSNNQDDWEYVAYFFGEFPDWSKIGSYTGTGYQIDIDLGFTTGNSSGGLGCVLIKRSDAGSSGDWYMWDRSFGGGIPTSGGTQFMKMNQIGDQYNLGNTTYINSLTSTGNPASGNISGLRITNTAANPVNVSGAEYVYWVLASLD